MGHEFDKLSEQYFLAQLKELISFLEEFTGRPFDYDRLKEVLRLSKEACRLWNEILDTAMLKPVSYTHLRRVRSLYPAIYSSCSYFDNWSFRGTIVTQETAKFGNSERKIHELELIHED